MNELSKRVCRRMAVMCMAAICAASGIAADQDAQPGLPPTFVDPSVRVVMEKRIEMPCSRTDRNRDQLSSIAWSPVTNQIAASDFPNHYLVDPEVGQVIGFQTELEGSPASKLAWSSESPLLVATSATDTHIYETNSEALEPPKLLRAIRNRVPRLLRADRHGMSLIATAKGEQIVLAGRTNKKLDPTNPEVAVFRLREDGRVMEWQFPADGTNYYLDANDAAASTDAVLLAGWVHHTAIATESRPQIDTVTLWLIDLQSGIKRCEIDPLNGQHGRGVSPNRYPPVLSADGRWLVLATGFSIHMYVYDTATCQQTHKVKVGASPAIGGYTFSRDGKWLVGTMPMYRGAFVEGRLSVWRTRDWKLVYDAPGPAHYAASFNKTGDRFSVGLLGGIAIYRIDEN